MPLFVWMGEILFRTKLSENLFEGLAPWLQKLPGGLIHVNVVGCALFAAISGSSAATVATVGKMSIPELRKRKYPEKILLGSLAGSGTLGLLIPPSIILIIYGVTVQESIAKLFIAGIIPGIMIALIFMHLYGEEDSGILTVTALFPSFFIIIMILFIGLTHPEATTGLPAWCRPGTY